MSKFRRMPFIVDIMLLEEPGKCGTNRGDAFYNAGDGLVKGKQRDTYPIPLDVMNANYEPADSEALRDLRIHLIQFKGQEATDAYISGLAARHDDLLERIALTICRAQGGNFEKERPAYREVADKAIRACHDFYDGLED